jgi:DNA-binding NarL/FixJ family response regulator
LQTDDVREESDQIRIVVCDTHPIMRAGVLAIVERDPRLLTVGQASNTKEALDVVERARPAVVVVSHGPAELDGATISRALGRHDGEERPLLRVVTLVSETSRDDSMEHRKETLGLLYAGVRGILLSQSAPTELTRVIHAVAAGNVVLATSSAVGLLERLVDRFAPTAATRAAALNELTERETEILQLVAAGMSNHVIADRLHLSEATVKSHFYHLSQKLDLQNRVQAVILAYEAGMVSPLG